MATPATPAPHKRHKRPLKNSILLLSRTIHIYLSMLALVTILFFAFTGFLLNHPGWFNLEVSKTTERDSVIPEDVAATEDKLTLVEYLRANEDARGQVKSFNRLEERTEVNFTGPGRVTQYSVYHATGDIKVRQETRNALAFLGDLHKGKYTGKWWPLVIDVTAWLLIAVSLTGLTIWCGLAKRRTIGLIAVFSGIAITVAVVIWLIP